MRELMDLTNQYMDFVVGAIAFFIALALFHKRFISPTLRKVEAMSILVSAQMTENGGGSLVDKVSRIPHLEKAVSDNHLAAEKRWTNLEGGIEDLSRRVTKVEYAVLNKEEK